MIVEINVKQELAAMDKRIEQLRSDINYLAGMRNILASVATETIQVNVPDEVKATRAEA